MIRRVTLQNLAAELELSPSTVSRALRGHALVNEETRKAVNEAAERLGYTGHLARLATLEADEPDHHKPIVWVTPLDNFEYEDPIILELIGGMASRCAEIGRHLLVVPTEANHELDTYREFSASGLYGGFVLANAKAEGDRRVEFLLDRGIPFVIHGHPPLNRDYPWLDVAVADAHAQATRYLLELGHRRIAHLNSMPGFRLSVEREKGYRIAMHERDARISENWVLGGPKSEEFGYRMMHQLLDGLPAPTALLCSSVMMAKGAMFALSERSLAVGRDFSLIAYDDNVAGTFYSVPLTTLFSPIRPVGRHLIRLLERAMAGEDYARLNHVVVPELIVRSSTGPIDTEAEERAAAMSSTNILPSSPFNSGSAAAMSSRRAAPVQQDK